MKPAPSAGKDLLASMAAAHCIASYVVMITWVLLIRPREGRVIWAVFVIGAPLAIPFFVILAGIFGVARSDARALAGFAIAYALVFITATIAIYQRRRSEPRSTAG